MFPAAPRGFPTSSPGLCPCWTIAGPGSLRWSLVLAWLCICDGCDIDHLFLCLLASVCDFLEAVAVPGLCPVFNWICLGWCVCSLCFLHIKPSSDTWFSDIFCCAVDCLTFFIQSLEVQKLILTKSKLAVFSFCCPWFLYQILQEQTLDYTHSCFCFFCTFSFYTWVVDLFWVNSYMWGEVGVQSFYMWLSSCPSTICWRYYSIF